MPVWQRVSYRERAVDPKSPSFSLTPLGESRAEMRVWVEWDDLCVSPAPPPGSWVGAVEGVTPAAAPGAFLGYAVFSSFWPGEATFLSYSPELLEFPLPGKGAGGRLPFSHPDFPPGLMLCDSLSATGDVPQGQTVRGSAAFDEGNIVLGFRRTPGGYRALPDSLVCIPPGAANPGALFVPPDVPLPAGAPGDGSSLPGLSTPLIGYGAPLPGAPAAGSGPPQEYFCCRNMSCVEKSTTIAQSIPAKPSAGGLVWLDSPVGAGGNRTAATIAAYIPLHALQITLDWYPVPLGYWFYVEPKFRALVGKTNRNPFPPAPPPGCPRSRMTQQPRGTLVFGQYDKDWISMGNGAEALRIRLKMKAYPHAGGANAFYWVNPPASMGPPGYYRVGRRDGSLLFPEADYASAFYAGV